MSDELHPFAGMATGLHNHTPDAECDDTCTDYPAAPKRQPTILPTWLWDQMAEAHEPTFVRLRDEGLIVRNDPNALVAAGGWCAPNESLFALPEIGISRGGATYPSTPPAPVPAPNRAERRRAWRKDKRRRLRSATFAARKAWSCPDGWWEED